MSDVFPKWTNQLPRKLALGMLLATIGIATGVTYYFTPKYSRVGYQPQQPVAFSHNTHVNQVGMDCRYCHTTVEKSCFSSLPATSTCMNCHDQILKTDPRLALVRESAATGKPIPWVQVHKLPDYVLFNHAVHVNRGVSCVECHGRVNAMDEIYHAQALSMSFCLDCHRNPEPRLRPLAKVTQLDWQPTNDVAQLPRVREAMGDVMVRDWNIQKLESCSTCHK